MNRDEVLSMLGLSKKAGKLMSGSFAVEGAIKSGKCYLVVTAEDASERTKKDVKNACEYYGVPLLYYATKERLGAAIGKEYVAEIAIMDKKLAGSIQAKHLKTQKMQGQSPSR